MAKKPRTLSRAAKWGALLTRDYFPVVNPWIRRVGTPLGSLGLATIASALCGLVLHPQGFVVCFVLLVVIGLGVAWPVLTVRGLVGTLNFDRERVREGATVNVRLSLRNRMPWDAWGLMVEGGFSREAERRDGEDPAASVAFARGWRTTEVSWEFVFKCRGVYPLRSPRIASGFPFGLREASRPLVVDAPLVVWPRTFPVGPVPETSGGRSSEGFAPRDTPGTTGDVLGVRPYRRGDSLRRIHWPQTARHDQLVVCEMQSRAVPWVQLILDTHDDAHQGEGPTGSREWAIRVAASLLERWTEQGARIEAVFDGRVIEPRGGPLASRRSRFLDELARIGANGFWTLGDLLESPACRLFKGGLRVVVTTDLGLRRLPTGALRGPRERLVVLKASAFGRSGEARHGEPPAMTPWIWIDDPDRVSDCVGKAWKEVRLGS
jgi:uncharacterized protein (DUF58 family)